MANTSAPFGFSQYTGTGSLPTYEQVQMAISPSNTGGIFFGDPVMQAASATGVGTGLITQAYAPVTLTGLTGGIVTSAGGVATITFSAATPANSGTLPSTPNAWAPPVGSQIVVSGAAPVTLNGVYTVTSSTTTTAVAIYSSGNAGPASVTSTTFGTVTIYVPVAGIFVGCKYLSVAQKRTVWSNYWPGSDANTNANVTAYVVNDPNAQFVVQTANSNTTSSAVGIANIGQNIGFVYGNYYNTSGTQVTGLTNGNTATGLSTAYADQYSLSTPGGYQPLLPFRVVALANYTPDGSNPLQSINGNDYTSAYNRIVVAFNNAMLKQSYGV